MQILSPSIICPSTLTLYLLTTSSSPHTLKTAWWIQTYPHNPILDARFICVCEYVCVWDRERKILFFYTSYFVLGYSWLTTSWQFQVKSEGTQPYFLRKFSWYLVLKVPILDTNWTYLAASSAKNEGKIQQNFSTKKHIKRYYQSSFDQ